jgi:hypothetical protein
MPHLPGVLVGLAVAAAAVLRQDPGRKAHRQQRGEAQVPDFDLAAVAVDVDLVAPQVAMDDGRRLGVQVVEPQQHLCQDSDKVNAAAKLAPSMKTVT